MMETFAPGKDVVTSLRTSATTDVKPKASAACGASTASSSASSAAGRAGGAMVMEGRGGREQGSRLCGKEKGRESERKRR